jgi:hypothetical protein
VLTGLALSGDGEPPAAIAGRLDHEGEGLEHLEKRDVRLRLRDP